MTRSFKPSFVSLVLAAAGAGIVGAFLLVSGAVAQEVGTFVVKDVIASGAGATKDANVTVMVNTKTGQTWLLYAVPDISWERVRYWNPKTRKSDSDLPGAPVVPLDPKEKIILVPRN